MLSESSNDRAPSTKQFFQRSSDLVGAPLEPPHGMKGYAGSATDADRSRLRVVGVTAVAAATVLIVPCRHWQTPSRAVMLVVGSVWVVYSPALDPAFLPTGGRRRGAQQRG